MPLLHQSVSLSNTPKLKSGVYALAIGHYIVLVDAP